MSSLLCLTAGWLLIPVRLLAQQPSQDAEARVRTAIESLGRAMASQDREGIARQFHIPRMVQELHDRGGFPLPEGDEEKDRLLTRIRETMPGMASALAGLGMPVEKLRALSVKVKAGDLEAEVIGRMTCGGSRSKVRFWLAREDAEWKVFDMEFMEYGIRLSMTVGSVIASVGKDQEASRILRKAMGDMFKAYKALTSGEFEQARELLEAPRASKLPDQVSAWIDLLDAVTLHLLEQHTKALEAADRALRRDKSLLVCQFIKGSAYVALEEYEKAIACEKEFLQSAGDDPDAWAVIGDAYEKLEKVELATEAYRKGAACDDEDFTNRLNLGRLLVDAGKVAEAKAILREASRNAPPEEETFDEAAALLDGVSEFATVLDLALERAQRTPDDQSVLLWQGRALRKLGRLKEAEKALTRIPSKDREDSDAQEELVFVLAQAGRDPEARQEGGKRIEGDEEDARYLRLFLGAAAGRMTQALEELRPLLELDESYADRIRKEPAFDKLRLEGEVMKVLRPAQERHDFLQSIQKLPSGDREAMLRLARARQEVAPDDPWAFYYQGFSLRRLGRFEEAEKALVQALAKNKKPPASYRDELGRALAAQGKTEQALAIADEIEKSEDAKAEALTLRAVAYVFAKKPQEALRVLEKLLEEHAHLFSAVKSDPDLGELKNLPAFQELLKKAKEDK
jgi:tetratricopeptide (TPR) repeat protein